MLHRGAATHRRIASVLAERDEGVYQRELPTRGTPEMLAASRLVVRDEKSGTDCRRSLIPDHPLIQFVARGGPGIP